MGEEKAAIPGIVTNAPFKKERRFIGVSPENDKMWRAAYYRETKWGQLRILHLALIRTKLSSWLVLQAYRDPVPPRNPDRLQLGPAKNLLSLRSATIAD